MLARLGRSQANEMADAAEDLSDVLDALHACCAPPAPPPGDSAAAAAAAGGGEVGAGGLGRESLVTRTFGLHLRECTACAACGYEMPAPPSTRFFHFVPALQLGRAWTEAPGWPSPEQVLRRTYENDRRPCPRCSAGAEVPFGCAYTLLGGAPDVLSLVVVWGAAEAAGDDVADVLAVLPLSLDLQQLYSGVAAPRVYRLRAVVCFYGRHYVLLAYNPRVKLWVQYDDASVRAVGRWVDVAAKCRTGRYQPHLVLYEAAPSP
jgi:hypothetical protein